MNSSPCCNTPASRNWAKGPRSSSKATLRTVFLCCGRAAEGDADDPRRAAGRGALYRTRRVVRLRRRDRPAVLSRHRECGARQRRGRMERGSEASSLVEKHPKFGAHILRMMSGRVQEAHARMREMATERVERRVARALLRLAREAGKRTEAGIEIAMPLSRQDVAEMTGTTLYTVSRLLSAWEEEGLVDVGRQRIVIRTTARACQIAEDLRRARLVCGRAKTRPAPADIISSFTILLQGQAGIMNIRTMIDIEEPRRAYRGPVILASGHRPFFLAAGLSAALGLALWVVAIAGYLPMSASWHGHEMIFGFAVSAIARVSDGGGPEMDGRQNVLGLAACWSCSGSGWPGRVAMIADVAAMARPSVPSRLRRSHSCRYRPRPGIPATIRFRPCCSG